MNTAEQLRFYVADKPRFSQETYFGNGSALVYQISGFPMVTGATGLGGMEPGVFIRNANSDGWTATSLSATGLGLGTITFGTPIQNGMPFQIRYTYATFSDQEIDFITALKSGDLKGMRMEILNLLIADYSKRSRWNAQGVSVDDSIVVQNLIRAREILWKEMTIEQGAQGGIESWSENQQNYA